MGSAGAADFQCNSLASAAGINDAAGTGYIAWLSTTVSNAKARLGDMAIRGWRRMDGAILADDQTSLFTGTSPKFMNSIRYNELGATVTTNTVLLTGTNANGATATTLTCTDWTV